MHISTPGSKNKSRFLRSFDNYRLYQESISDNKSRDESLSAADLEDNGDSKSPRRLGESNGDYDRRGKSINILDRLFEKRDS